MRILFDNGVPAPLRSHLMGHDIDTAFERGWAAIRNSELLQNAEEHGYSLLITTDHSMRYQQNLTGRTISIIVIKTDWPLTRQQIDTIRAAIDDTDSIGPGGLSEIF